MLRIAKGAFMPGLVACGFLCSGGTTPVVAQAAGNPDYAVKPPVVHLPPGVKPGQYRRIFEPFGNWTLVCDENLKVKHMVCNVSQSIIDKAGSVVFSWSLAATEKGKPFMILRATPNARTVPGFQIGFPGTEPIKVPFDGCNKSVCLGRIAVGPALSKQIGQGAEATITYYTTTDGRLSFQAPLAGLRQAVSAIK